MNHFQIQHTYIQNNIATGLENVISCSFPIDCWPLMVVWSTDPCTRVLPFTALAMPISVQLLLTKSSDVFDDVTCSRHVET